MKNLALVSSFLEYVNIFAFLIALRLTSLTPVVAALLSTFCLFEFILCIGDHILAS